MARLSSECHSLCVTLSQLSAEPIERCAAGEKRRKPPTQRSGAFEGTAYGIRTRGKEAARNQLARCNPPFYKDNLYATLSQGAAQVLASVHSVGTHWAPHSRGGSAEQSATTSSCPPRCSVLAHARAEGHCVQHMVAVARSVLTRDLEQGSLFALGQGARAPARFGVVRHREHEGVRRGGWYGITPPPHRVRST